MCVVKQKRNNLMTSRKNNQNVKVIIGIFVILKNTHKYIKQPKFCRDRGRGKKTQKEGIMKDKYTRRKFLEGIII